MNENSRDYLYQPDCKKSHIIPFSDVQTGLLPPPLERPKKRVKISSETPSVCVYDKNKSVLDIHKKNPDILFPPLVNVTRNTKKKKKKLRSPIIDRHPILIDPPEQLQTSVCRRRKRQQRLMVMDKSRKRKERMERLKQFNNISELKLKMKFGELSDDFYLYCRKYQKNNDEEVRRIIDEVDHISKPIKYHLCFNFRFFTKIMIQKHNPPLFIK